MDLKSISQGMRTHLAELQTTAMAFWTTTLQQLQSGSDSAVRISGAPEGPGFAHVRLHSLELKTTSLRDGHEEQCRNAAVSKMEQTVLSVLDCSSEEHGAGALASCAAPLQPARFSL